MKVLLSSNSQSSTLLSAQDRRNNDDYKDNNDEFKICAYIHNSCGYWAHNNHDEIPTDHFYIKINWRNDSLFINPMRTLFVHPATPAKGENEIIELELVSPPLPVLYDRLKAMSAMEDSERQISVYHQEDGNPDWEEHISRTNWTVLQTRLFNKVVSLLRNDRMARLAYQGNHNEPVLRRISVDKTACRMRQALASVQWNNKYTQWIHTTMMDNLSSVYLVCYLDALQTLKSKVPSLVDRMISSSNPRSTITPNQELLNIVQKRHWDPLCGGISRYKLSKLPQDPILVMVPSGPGPVSSSNSRTHHWMANFSALGTVVCVYTSPGRMVGSVSISNCLDHMLASTRAKVVELHAEHGNKPIILVGLGSGAALACQVALIEKVTAVVCLGFPLYTVEGSRETSDDNILNLTSPVLFIIGQNAATCSVEDMESMRDKLNVVSSLVVVGGADDQLRLTKSKKKLDGITQTIADKCIMDEVSNFLGNLLRPDYTAPVRSSVLYSQHHIDQLKRVPVNLYERKRKALEDISKISDVPITLPAKKGRKPKAQPIQKQMPVKWAKQMSLATESPRTPIPLSSQVTLTNIGTSPSIIAKNLSPVQKKVHSLPAASASTITVVAASNPNIAAATAAQNRLSSGQLTSLSSILEPGNGDSSPTCCSVTTDGGVINLRSLNSLSANTPDLSDELNILDMPVILGDQNLDDPIVPEQPQPQPILFTKKSPVKFILSKGNSLTKPRISPIKYDYISQTKSPVKIYISKANQKPLFVSGVDSIVPRMQNIPNTKKKPF